MSYLYNNRNHRWSTKYKYISRETHRSAGNLPGGMYEYGMRYETDQTELHEEHNT